MPIIFGIRRKAYRLATAFAMCRLCGTPAAQAVVRLRTFFTLFFLPVLPLTSRYRTTCTMCGGSVKVTREEAVHLAALAQAGPRSAPPPVPTEVPRASRPADRAPGEPGER